MNRDPYRYIEEARYASVNRNAEMAREREVRNERRKKARKVYRIQGAILASLVLISSYFLGGRTVEAFSNYSNDSTLAGYSAVSHETHRTDDGQNFWYDYGDIAATFNDEYDFDSFVYGTYQKISGGGSGRTLINMNDLFYHFYINGLTPYSSFEDYCLAHGFSKEKDGKIAIDVEKYEKGVRDYLKDLKLIEKADDNVQEFRSK